MKMLSVMKHSLRCHECKRLEREYQLAVAEIYSVVGGRFKTVGEKLRELLRWQDVRDKAVKAIEHNKTHATVPSDTLCKTAEPLQQPNSGSRPMRSSA
jgi:hypothetical protein